MCIPDTYVDLLLAIDTKIYTIYIARKQIPFNRSTEIYLTSQTNYDGEHKCGV